MVNSAAMYVGSDVKKSSGSSVMLTTPMFSAAAWLATVCIAVLPITS